jgi:AcrR family transcriptional regulator
MAGVNFLVIAMEIKTDTVELRQKRGRPLSFDRSAALDAAMLTFWRHGYETTSIADLTTAMGVTAPSLYNAFGDKKLLFLEAARRYAGDPEAFAAMLASAPTARQAIHDLLVSTATAFASDETPKGCLLASATASVSKDAADVQQAVAEIRHLIASVICNRIQNDIQSGQTSKSTDAQALSLFVVAAIQGLSVLARDGVDRATLVKVASIASRAWH